MAESDVEYMDRYSKVKTPNSDILLKRSKEHDAISQFLDFCSVQGIGLYRIADSVALRYEAVDDTETLYKFLGINYKELDCEREALLDAIRRR